MKTPTINHKYLVNMSLFSEFVKYAYQLQNSVSISSFRGGSGERKVHFRLRTGLGREYKIFHNLLIPNGKPGNFSQIDHLVLSKFGIFCIETKAHNAKIYGSAQSSKFKAYYGNTSFDMVNPILQNRTHARSLAKLLGLDESSITRLTVFPYTKYIKADGCESEICDFAELVSSIKSQTVEIFSEHQLAEMEKIIGKHSRSNDPVIVNKHRQRVSLLVQHSA